MASPTPNPAPPFPSLKFNTLHLWGVPEEEHVEVGGVEAGDIEDSNLVEGRLEEYEEEEQYFTDSEAMSEDEDHSDSDDYLEYSSPILGTPSKKRKVTAQKRENRRREQNLAQQDTQLEKEYQAAKMSTAAAAEKRNQVMASVLDLLGQEGYQAGDFIDWFLDPKSPTGRRRWTQFWSHKTRFETIMANISTAKNSTRSGRERVDRWALKFVKSRVRSESARITRSRVLQSYHKPVDESFVFGFSLDSIESSIESMCPNMFSIMQSFATSTRQERESRKKKKGEILIDVQKRKVMACAALALLREYNQYNNYFQQVTGVFLYASGLPRQAYGVLSHLGVVTSYSSLVRSTPRPSRLPSAQRNEDAEPTANPKPRRRGLLYELSDSCRISAQNEAEDALYAVTYDNVNFMARVGEQRVGRKDTQENGTCATLYRVPDINIDDIALAPLRERLKSAPPLQLDDLSLSPNQHALQNDSLVDAVLSIIVSHAGVPFARYQKLLERDRPTFGFQVPNKPTRICPLPAMNINEGSVDGNIDAVTAIYKELKVENSALADSVARFFAGDQLTVAHIRTAYGWRTGNEVGLDSLEQVVAVPGLFHVVMTVVTMILETFWSGGKSGSNPTSLSFQNTLLKRKPLVLFSSPPYRTCRDLIMVSLYSRVLLLLPTVAGAQDLEDYGRKLTGMDTDASAGLEASWKQLKADATQIVARFASGSVAAELRRQREAQQDDSQSETDMVLEYSILFFRDALLLRSFLNAVKRGQSGLIVPILKTWALGFRGGTHPKYAYEMLVFIHNYTHVWPESIRDTVLKAWLVNTTGRPNSCTPTDLLQEHMNLLIKRIYATHGSNRSWEWLSMISPCANVLCQVAREFHSVLGEDQGSKHTTPDLTSDMSTLMTSMLEHRVYELVPGRQLGGNSQAPVDVLTNGYATLAHGPKNSIDEFNSSIRRLQTRAQNRPLGLAVPTVSNTPTTVTGLNDAARNDTASAENAPSTTEQEIEDLEEQAELGAPETQEPELDEVLAEDMCFLDLVGLDDAGLDSDDDRNSIGSQSDYEEYNDL